MNAPEQILLKMSNVSVSFSMESFTFCAVDDLSFHINRGEIFGLVGESGSGKTMTALSIMRLIPPPGKIVKGSIFFEGTDLIALPEEQMQLLRGRKVAMVFQEPMTSLNPVFRVGDQVREILTLHTDLTKKDAEAKAVALLGSVGFELPQQKYLQYPHQLSGGQRQRVLIAIAVACNPSLIIADEPTTALDVATEGQILCLLQDLVQGQSMSMLFITHNLHVMQNLGTRIGIMYAGRMMEMGMVTEFFREPLHPYSEGLIESSVRLTGAEDRLRTIPGFVPKLSELPQGCKFHPRCRHVMAQCKREEPPLLALGGERWVRCYLYQN